MHNSLRIITLEVCNIIVLSGMASVVTDMPQAVKLIFYRSGEQYHTHKIRLVLQPKALLWLYVGYSCFSTYPWRQDLIQCQMCHALISSNCVVFLSTVPDAL